MGTLKLPAEVKVEERVTPSGRIFYIFTKQQFNDSQAFVELARRAGVIF